MCGHDRTIVGADGLLGQVVQCHVHAPAGIFAL